MEYSDSLAKLVKNSRRFMLVSPLFAVFQIVFSPSTNQAGVEGLVLLQILIMYVYLVPAILASRLVASAAKYKQGAALLFVQVAIHLIGGVAMLIWSFGGLFGFEL